MSRASPSPPSGTALYGRSITLTKKHGGIKIKTHKFFYVLVFVGMMSVLIFGSSVIAEQSYLMVCKGNSTGSLRTSLHIYPNEIKLLFIKSPYAGNKKRPDPGQCAWMDRPINQNEPSVVKFISPGVGKVTRLSFYDGGCFPIFETQTATNFKRHITEQRIFHFLCYNNGKHFVITKIGRKLKQVSED